MFSGTNLARRVHIGSGMTTAQTAPVKLAPMAARIIAALQYPGMRTMTTLDHLNGRLVAMFPATCTRCYGSGMFGPQCVKGGVCFKCNGKRAQAPKINKALDARVMAAIAAGELQAYAERMIAAGAARKAVAGQYDAAFKDQFKTAWYACFYADGRGGTGPAAYPLNHQIHDMIQPFEDAARKADNVIKFGKGTPADVDACVAALQAWRDACAQCDRAHALCLERGLYAEAHAAYSEAKALERGSYEAQQRVYKRFHAVAVAVWAEAAAV
jgi:hypothetical protein